MSGEPWEPKTRDDYVGMFADALSLDRQRRTEAEEKAAAEKAKQNPAPEAEPARPRTLQERILGIPAKAPKAD